MQGIHSSEQHRSTPSGAHSRPPASQQRPHSGGAQAIWHDLDGLAIQRNDAHRTLIIDGIWVRLAPLEYQVMLPLIQQFNRPVSAACICQAAFGCAYSDAEAARLYRHVERLRSKLAAFGIGIACLNKKRGYMLLRDDSFDGGSMAASE